MDTGSSFLEGVMVKKRRISPPGKNSFKSIAHNYETRRHVATKMYQSNEVSTNDLGKSRYSFSSELDGKIELGKSTAQLCSPSGFQRTACLVDFLLPGVGSVSVAVWFSTRVLVGRKM
mmetsp:Transcript_7885/g.16434  ORF Transcript_7885/g.16434 Transcript_7885/m.16434 type:complete len:118 (+) Transcript_7885:283-636(+)